MEKKLRAMLVDVRKKIQQFSIVYRTHTDPDKRFQNPLCCALAGQERPLENRLHATFDQKSALNDATQFTNSNSSYIPTFPLCYKKNLNQ